MCRGLARLQSGYCTGREDIDAGSCWGLPEGLGRNVLDEVDKSHKMVQESLYGSEGVNRSYFGLRQEGRESRVDVAEVFVQPRSVSR